MRTEVTALLGQFQQPMKELAERAGELDIRAFEIADAERIAAELRPPVLTLLREARQILGRLLVWCESAGPLSARDGPDALRSSYLPFERAIDATIAARLGSFGAVEEIAFIAQLELRQREERLDRVRPEQGSVLLLGECDSSLRRIRKALSAVDAAIAEASSTEPLLVFASELETSLAVRRAYAKFRGRILADGEPSVDTLHSRFRAAGTHIAMILGWSVYPDMRVRDRLLLRELQQRILDWLRRSNSLQPSEGLRLWQDLAACVEMLSLVSRRQELIEHDSGVIFDVLENLRSKDGDVDDLTWSLLVSLEGLDAELDLALAARPRPTRAFCVRVLSKLAAGFSRLSTRPPPKGVAP
jgi:hypothetical protein